MRALLDVNVLIALLDSGHIQHDNARQWLTDNIEDGWASCPLTQNGCIRIMSQPAYPGNLTPAEVSARLSRAVTTQWHQFWPDSVTLVGNDAIAWNRVLGSRQVTDTYLLALAASNNGRLVTFDRSIAVTTVQGALSEHLVLL